MGLYSLIFTAFGGIAFFIFLVQLFVLIKKGAERNFISGIIISAILVFYIVTVLVASNFDDNQEDFLTVLKIQLIFVVLLILSLFASFFLQMNSSKKKYYYAGFSLLSLLVLASLVLPVRSLFGENSELNLLVLAYGQRFLMLDPGFTLWRGIIDSAIILYSLFMLICLVRNASKLAVSYLLWYSLALSALVVAGLTDHLIDMGSVQLYYTVPAGLFINYVILAMIPFYQRLKEVFKRSEMFDLDVNWRAFVEQSNVIVVTLNRMGHVEYINPYFLRLTGFRENEVVGNDWFEFFVPSEQHYDVQSAFIEILEFDFHSKYRNPIVTKYQEQRMIEWHNVRLRSNSAQVTGSISIGIDITDENEEKESLKRKLREAEELIDRLRREGKVY
jgi:PAS domain S-box-containing protein